MKVSNHRPFLKKASNAIFRKKRKDPGKEVYHPEGTASKAPEPVRATPDNPERTIIYTLKAKSIVFVFLHNYTVEA